MPSFDGLKNSRHLESLPLVNPEKVLIKIAKKREKILKTRLQRYLRRHQFIQIQVSSSVMQDIDEMCIVCMIRIPRFYVFSPSFYYSLFNN